MKNLKPLLSVTMLAAMALSGLSQTDQQQYDQAMDKLNRTANKRERFYALDNAAKAAFNIRNLNQAKYLAEELLGMSNDFADDWNFGNAIHAANIVLGRIALAEGRIGSARQYLLRAGSTPGSPQLKSFGPNMALAKELLARGDRETVLQYFKLCSKFWPKKFSKIPQWTLEVQKGNIPDFGPNLAY